MRRAVPASKSCVMLLALLTIGLFVSAANAEESNFYLFGQLGFATSKVNGSANDDALSASGYANVGSTSGDTYSAVKAGAGYQITRNLALEASYIRFADANGYSATFTNGGAPTWWTNGNTVKTMSTSGYGLSMIGTLPVSHDVSLLARASYYLLKTDVFSATTLTDGITTSTLQSSAQTTDRVGSVGVGASFAVDPRAVIRLEAEFFGKIAKDLGAINELRDTRLLSLGVAYLF